MDCGKQFNNKNIMSGQAIRTRYFRPTDTRGARIKADCDAGSVVIPYPYECNTNDAHRMAAKAMLEKLAKEAVKRHGTERAGDCWRWKTMITGWIPGHAAVHVEGEIFNGEASR